jgi:AraC-like DNA-binding protein
MRLYVRDRVLYIPSLHAAWIPAGVEHRVATESINIIFRSLYLDYSGLSDKFYNSVNVFFANSLMREMLLYTERFNLNDPATEHEISFLEALKQLLPKIAKSKIDLHLPTTVNPNLEPVLEYMHAHFGEKISVPKIALLFGVSERTLSRLFKQELRMSLIQYLKLLRMVRAVEMLVQPGKNVSEVAYAVGYESLPSFSNNFTEIMGIRPNSFLSK